MSLFIFFGVVSFIFLFIRNRLFALKEEWIVDWERESISWLTSWMAAIAREEPAWILTIFHCFLKPINGKGASEIKNQHPCNMLALLMVTWSIVPQFQPQGCCVLYCFHVTFNLVVIIFWALLCLIAHNTYFPTSQNFVLAGRPIQLLKCK